MEFESRMRVFIINFVLVFVGITSIYFTTQIHEEFLKELFSFDFQHIFTFFIIFFIELTVLGILLYKFFSNRRKRIADSDLLHYKDINREQKNARNSVFFPRNNKFFEREKSALYISQNVQITTKKSHEHILLLGPTGSGKSASFFLPNLLNVDNVSLVVTDPKGELCRKSGPSLKKKGYKVIHLDLRNPEESANYNLLANARNHDDVRKIADSVLMNGEGAGKGDEWAKLSKTLLEMFLFHEFDKGEKYINNVIKQMAKLDLKNELEAENFFRNSSEEAYMSFLQYKKLADGASMISGMFATAQGNMKTFENDNIKAIGKRSDFSPSLLRQQKATLFVSYPEDEAELYSIFLSAFYTQLFSQIKSDRSVDETFGEMSGLPVYFLLDEFANIGKIPSVDVLLSTVRSKKMSLVLGIQSLDQLKKNYRDTFNIIVENCKTKIILGGATGDTADFFSKMVGEEEYTNMSFSQNDKSLSTSTSTNKKAILSADQIRRLKSYELVCVSDNLKPFKDNKNYYFLDRIAYFLFKNLPFSVEKNDEIIRKYTSWKEKKKAKEEVQEKKADFQQERQERNEERVMIRQEQVQKRALTKQEEIQKLIEQRRKRDLE
ncbi:MULTISPECIES: type IV secretory system conjugative DNA transfer family protein [Bacillus cereus group]|uniref:type IV secretory system conjugative DNA transfer family protein n=1 Tax=Bacillus cereus group TaxID=86661 RepID=UPI001BB44637|nr:MULTISPECIES: type IV secretory system conjugative DNA transfer family protein [Bacillus cereus group]